MNGRLLSPKQTCAVIFGASAWPRVPQLRGGRSFEKSAKDFIEYLCDKSGLGLNRDDSVLSLFDSALAAETQLDELSNMISRNQRLRNLIVYYVGHGAFAENTNQFYLMLRSSRPSNPASWLTADALSRLLKSERPFGNTILIVDSCFSGALAAAFQSRPAEYAAQKIIEEMPSRGTIVLCSSASNAVSMAPANSDYTMFTGALLDSLRHGSEAVAGDLTLEDLRDLIWKNMRDAFGELAVRPVLHEPIQDTGEIRRIPAFPNRGTKAVVVVDSHESSPAIANVLPKAWLLTVKKKWVALSRVGRLSSLVTASAILLAIASYPLVQAWLRARSKIEPPPVSNTSVRSVIDKSHDRTPHVKIWMAPDSNTCGGALTFQVHGNRLGCADGSNLPYTGSDVGPKMLDVRAIVVHQTEVPGNQIAPSLGVLTHGRTDLHGPLAHLLIGRDGGVFQMAPFDRSTPNVGNASAWNGVPIRNSDSIAIQLEAEANEFTAQQMTSAVAVVKAVMRAFNVRIVVGHKEVAIPHGRKSDPEFDMDEFRHQLGLNP